MTRRPPRSTLFPYTTSSDLQAAATAQHAPILRAVAPRQRRAAMLRARCEENYQVDRSRRHVECRGSPPEPASFHGARGRARPRSEEHTSELQSLTKLVCRLL